MRCRRVRRLLALFVGGDLSPRSTDAVELHLSNCADCHAEHETLEESRRALFCLKGPADGPAPDLWPELRSRLARERSRDRRRLPVRIAFAALILAMIAGVAVLLNPEPSGPRVPVTLPPIPELGLGKPRRQIEVAPEFPLSQVRSPDPLGRSIPAVRPPAPERASWDEF